MGASAPMAPMEMALLAILRNFTHQLLLYHKIVNKNPSTLKVTTFHKFMMSLQMKC